MPVRQFDMPNSYDFKSIGLFHINFCSLLHLLTKLISMFACFSKSNRRLDQMDDEDIEVEDDGEEQQQHTTQERMSEGSYGYPFLYGNGKYQACSYFQPQSLAHG